MQDKNKKKIISEKKGSYQNVLDVFFQDIHESKLFKHIAFDSDNNRCVFNQNSNIFVVSLEGTKQQRIKIPVKEYLSSDENSMYPGEIIPSSDCKYIAYTSEDNSICIQEISSKKVIPFTPNPANANTNKLVFNNNNTKLGALCNKDIIVWNINQPEEPTLRFTIPNHFNGASITFSPDSTQIAVAGSSSLPTANHTNMYTIHIFNTSNGNLIQTLKTELTGRAEKIIFTPDGKRIIASGYETISRKIYKSNFIIWNIENIKETSYTILDYAPSDQGAFILNSNGITMITGGNQKNKNTLELWDLSNYDNITHKTIANLSGICNSLAFNKDNTLLLSGDWYSGKLGYTTSLIRWDILDKEDNAVAENIKNSRPEAIKLLYQLYLKENVTDPSVFDDLPKNIQSILPKPSNYKVNAKDTFSSSPVRSSWRSWLRNLFDQLNYVP
jgi:WD40 repeat protein